MTTEEKKTDEAGEAVPKAKKPMSAKRKMTIGIIAVVVVAAGIGMYIWHETPNFCGTMCHTPMNSYLVNYESGDPDYMVTAHAQAGLECLDCHEAKLDQQVSEAVHFVSGTYEYNYDEQMLPSRKDELINEEFCLRSGCHDMTKAELTESTSNMARNPHDFSVHGGQFTCSSCHTMHGDQQTYKCAQCHQDASGQIPEGWNKEV